MTSRGHGEPKDRTTLGPLHPCMTSKVGFQSQEAKSWCGCIFAHSYLISWQHKQSESQYSRWRPLANLFSVAVTHNFSCGVSRHLQRFYLKSIQSCILFVNDLPTWTMSTGHRYHHLHLWRHLASYLHRVYKEKMKSWNLLSHNRHLACTEQAHWRFDFRW